LAQTLGGFAADIAYETSFGDGQKRLVYGEFQVCFDGVYGRIGHPGLEAEELGLYIFVGVDDAAGPGIDEFRADTAIFLVMFLEEAEPVLIYSGVGGGAGAQKEIAFEAVEGDQADGIDDQFLFNELIDLGAVANGLADLLGGIVDDLFQFLHEFVVLDHLFIEDL